MSRTALVAVGGNALVADNDHSSIDHQFGAARRLAGSLREMAADGWRFVVTHGNGPQVGFILRRSDLVAEIAPEIPRLELDVCVADSQGGIGYILSSALINEWRSAHLPARVTAMVTHTAVSLSDPAFENPTKPIGSFYSAEEARRLERSEGWAMVEDSGRGWRRVVPSPRPLRVVEIEAVAALLREGFTVIAGGGGGIPVVEEDDGTFRGIEAVIDKDFASALMASALGVDLLVITTGVPQVAIDFGTPQQRFIDTMGVAELEQHLADGQFPPGSMGPKIEAALQFLRSGGREVLITSPEQLGAALAGSTGTRLVSDPEAASSKQRSVAA
jgi:carbamate kinase